MKLESGHNLLKTVEALGYDQPYQYPKRASIGIHVFSKSTNLAVAGTVPALTGNGSLLRFNNIQTEARSADVTRLVGGGSGNSQKLVMLLKGIKLYVRATDVSGNDVALDQADYDNIFQNFELVGSYSGFESYWNMSNAVSTLYNDAGTADIRTVDMVGVPGYQRVDLEVDGSFIRNSREFTLKDNTITDIHVTAVIDAAFLPNLDVPLGNLCSRMTQRNEARVKLAARAKRAQLSRSTVES